MDFVILLLKLVQFDIEKNQLVKLTIAGTLWQNCNHYIHEHFV